MMFENSNNFTHSLSNWKDKLSKEVKNTINYSSVNKNNYPTEFSILFKPSDKPVFYNDTLAQAVDDWCEDPESAEQTHGHISTWDVSNVTDMSKLFICSTFNEDISNWDVSNVIDMSNMFDNINSFNQDIGSWDVSNVTNMSYMFHKASLFDKPLNNWDVSNVTDMSYMFDNAHSFNQDIGSWDVSNVKEMDNMFSNATVFNQPLNNWNVKNVENMNGMFEDAISFNQPINDWDLSSIRYNVNMFRGSTAYSYEIPEATRSQLDDEIPEAEIKNLWEGEKSTEFPLLTELSSEIPEKIGKLTTNYIISGIEEPINEIISDLIESDFNPIVLLKPDFKNFDVIGINWPTNKVFVECTDEAPDEWQGRTSYSKYINQPQTTYLKIPFKGFPIMVATPDWWGTRDKSIIDTIFFKLVERPKKLFKFMDYALTKVTETKTQNGSTYTNEYMDGEAGADHCNQRQNEKQISYDLVPISKSEIDAMESTIGGRGVKKPQKRVTRRRKYNSKKKSFKRTIKQSVKHKKRPKMTKKRKPHYNRYTKKQKTKNKKNKK
jgi:surface protein